MRAAAIPACHFAGGGIIGRLKGGGGFCFLFFLILYITDGTINNNANKTPRIIITLLSEKSSFGFGKFNFSSVTCGGGVVGT